MVNPCCIILFLLGSIYGYAQINPDNIDIIRDAYGVPHVYAATDAEVAYGFAWAQSEDHFKLMQEAYLAGNGLLKQTYRIERCSCRFFSAIYPS